MTCKNCVARVKNELLQLGDIHSAHVSLVSPQAIIAMSKHISTGTLQTAITRAGHYTISEAHVAAPQTEQRYVTNDEERDHYFPVFLIFGFITGIKLLVQIVKYAFSWMEWMGTFHGRIFSRVDT